MERIRTWRTNSVAALGPWLLLASLVWIALDARPIRAQFGGPQDYTVRVVDQLGRPLDGSLVRVEGASADQPTPATITADPGPQLFVIQPAFQGSIFAGGSLVPASPNGLQRAEMIFLDPMGGTVTIEWRTADVVVSVVDQNGVAVPGGTWGFAGGTGFYGSATVTAPITDDGVYPAIAGPSAGGWQFTARSAFDGSAIDLTRDETREVDESTSALSFTWRQVACTMGVVDAAGAPIRGATWTMFGHTFAAGDAIVLPTTEDASGAVLQGQYAAGLPATLFTNTASGTGSGTFEVLEDGTLAPAFIDVAGSAFGLRCGVSPFPPITTGTLEGTVLADGEPRVNASVHVADAGGGSTTLLTDASGNYLLSDVPQGTAVVTLALPEGYHFVDPPSGSRAVTIVAEATTRADFSIALDDVEPPPPPPPPPVVNNPETRQYWAREIRAALRGHGAHDEAFKDMRETYPLRIFDQFAKHETSPVRVEGVTQVDPDGSGPKLPRRLEIADMDATMEVPGNTALGNAKRELLVILLNVVSGRLSLNLIVDGEGTTLEEEIRRIAEMINDGKPANDRMAASHAMQINAGRGSPGRSDGYRIDDPSTAGLQDLDETSAASSPRVAVLRDGAAGRVRIAFTLASPGPATLDVYDARGRHLERIYAGDAPAGTTTVTWSRIRSGHGIYFARLQSADGPGAAKFFAAP
jgi:hypothetical protein